MKKNYSKFILKLLVLIFFPLILYANEIEILSDVPGTGPTIVNHSKITVHYRGVLEDGTEFDSSFKRNQPFVFQIGVRQVIPGWEIGLLNMQVGGKRRIKIPPELAYGSRGAGNFIPPNATLIFDIEIIAMQPPGYSIISVDDFITMKKKDLIIIDIRTKEEWKNTGVIKGSKKLTAFDLEGNFNPGFLNSFKLLTKKDNENTKVVFVSSKGDISSILANGFFEQLGYKKMNSLKGGINEWINLGNPIIK